MKRLLAVALLLSALFVQPVVAADKVITVATYNIKFLDAAKLPNQSPRKQRIKDVLSQLNADVIGLQEIDDRPALEAVFDKTKWALIIDDDSGSTQDVALAVRKSTLTVNGVSSDLDADNEHFLFSTSVTNSEFPNRRDVLFVELTVKETGDKFTVMVVHAKSRFGGRASNDHRRENAARKLVQRLEQDFDEKAFVILGDYNDNPDDRSLNILESGDPGKLGGPEVNPGPFLINLTETLCAVGHVSHGRKSNDISNGKINTIDSLSRSRNNNARGTNANTGDILFDQLLVSDGLNQLYIQDSAKVFDGGVAAEGNDNTRASDHLPVFAQFRFQGMSPGTPAGGVQLLAVLPNPDGIDRGNEEVHLSNNGADAITVTGWLLQDRAGNEFTITGTVPGNGMLKITLPAGKLPLNNTGDEVTLFNVAGDEVDSESYSKSDAKPGDVVIFP